MMPCEVEGYPVIKDIIIRGTKVMLVQLYFTAQRRMEENFPSADQQKITGNSCC